MNDHATGKRWTEDQSEKEKGLKDGQGLCGRTEPALSDGCGCCPPRPCLCLSGPQGKKEGFQEVVDHPDQCGGEDPRPFLQLPDDCLEESPCRIGPKDMGRAGSERPQRLFEDC